MSLIFHLFQNNYLPETVALWNTAAAACHGFHPLTEDNFREHVLYSPNFSPECLITASYHGSIVGMLHYDIVDVFPYPRAGVITAICVHPDHRNCGYAQQMLQEAVCRLERQGVNTIDALGSWPYSSYYAGMIDGSERAGPDVRDTALIWIFEKFRFRKMRESLIMRAPVPAAAAGTGADDDIASRIGAELVYCQPRDGKTTWLDRAFRFWQHHDHILLNEQGQVLSNAIFARMRGYCEYTGQEIYSVYGINTPEHCRRCGFATRNLQLLRARLAGLGAQMMEIHVYADNIPAVKLYKRIEFSEIGRNVIMRRTR